MIKALLVALFAMLFIAVVPSISASAATGQTTSTNTCTVATCPGTPPTPPNSTHPNTDGQCGINYPCPIKGSFVDSQPPHDSDLVQISAPQLAQLYQRARDADANAAIATMFAATAGVFVVVLLITLRVALVKLGRQKLPESPDVLLHNKQT